MELQKKVKAPDKREANLAVAIITALKQRGLDL